jgi:hypothetical protein
LEAFAVFIRAKEKPMHEEFFTMLIMEREEVRLRKKH